jgi:hypothetical protein
VVREDHVGQQPDLELRIVREETALLQASISEKSTFGCDQHAVPDDALYPRVEECRRGKDVEDELPPLTMRVSPALFPPVGRTIVSANSE